MYLSLKRIACFRYFYVAYVYIFVLHFVHLTPFRYGPLVKHWTMRFEAKHNHLKKLAQNIGNFINIPLTLASRHQYWQCYKWLDGVALMEDGPEIGPGTCNIFNDLNAF